MNEREYNKLRVKVEAEYHEKLKALELVYKMSGGAKGGGSSAFTNGNLANEVRKAVESQPGIFNVRDVVKSIVSANPGQTSELNKTSISGVLRRLEADRQIVLVERGKGKRATTYERSGSKEDELPPVPVVAKVQVVGG